MEEMIQLGVYLQMMAQGRTLYSLEKETGLAGHQIKAVFEGKNSTMKSFIKICRALNVKIVPY